MSSFRFPPFRSALLGACLAIPFPAAAWTQVYTQTYLMGDSDSRLSARQNVIARIQQQAAQESGTYIQGTTQLVNDRLDEHIRQESAAIVRVEVVYEKFDLLPSGQVQLALQARATVDDSVLQDRIRDLRQREQGTGPVVAAPDPRLEQILARQARLAEENEAMRRRLELLVSPAARPREAAHPTPATPSAGEPEWLEPLLSGLRQLPVRPRIVSRLGGQDSNTLQLGIQTAWRIGLERDSPLDRLCREWRCEVGWTLRTTRDDMTLPPLHQALYRPVSRPAHMNDKLMTRWRFLSLQARPPQPLTAAEEAVFRARIGERPLFVRTRIADQEFLLPLLNWSAAVGGLVLSLEGTSEAASLQPYESGSGTGDLLCTPAYKGGVCADRLPAQYAVQTVRVSRERLARMPVLESGVVAR